MEIIYYGGIGEGFKFPEKIDLSKEKITGWKSYKLKGWMSPNLRIEFDGRKSFESPVGLICNYDKVIKYLKGEYLKQKLK